MGTVGWMGSMGWSGMDGADGINGTGQRETGRVGMGRDGLRQGTGTPNGTSWAGGAAGMGLSTPRRANSPPLTPPAATGSPGSSTGLPPPLPGPQHLPLHPGGCPGLREWGWGGHRVGRGGPGPSRRVTCPPKPRPQACGDDADGYRAVEEAMAVIGFSPEEMGSVRRILATILHLVRPPPVWTRPCPVHQYVPRQTSMAPTHQYVPLTPVQSWADQYEYPPPV